MGEQAFQASQSMTDVVSARFCLGKESQGRREWRRGYECGHVEGGDLEVGGRWGLVPPDGVLGNL